MASRLVENIRLQWTAETQLDIHSPFLDGFQPLSGKPGKQLAKFEYMAMLNGGEMVRCVLHDPFFTMINPPTAPESAETYYGTSRIKAPVNIKSRLIWAKSASGRLKTPWGNHALVGLSPYGDPSNLGFVEFIGVDYASWHLNGGDAGGYRYKGNIKKVIEQVVDKYSRGQLKVDFRTETQDNDENQWWQMRLDPKSYILSLLDWSPSITSNKTRWFIYPDDEDGPGKVIFVEQADIPSIHRSTYHWKGYGKGPPDYGHGDVLEWELVGDNALQQVRHKVVTNGISTVAGGYWDRRNPGPEKIVYVGDKQTPNKYKAKTNPKNAFTRPEPCTNPLDPYPKSVGWTTMPMVPEIYSAGDLGIRYQDYIDGRARHWYLRLNNQLMRVRFRIMGHHIWAGSEGLGVDTIDIIMREAKEGKKHFLNGNWIVYGYHHVMTNTNWTTDLYCARLDHDADAKPVGSG